MKKQKQAWIQAILFLLLCGSLTACVNLLPKFKYQLEGLKDTPQFIIYKDQCVKSLININELGDFVGKDELAIPLPECLEDLLICYPGGSQAKLEGLIKAVFEQYRRQ